MSAYTSDKQKELVMHMLFKLVAAVFAGSLLAGCGDEDFTGAYRFNERNTGEIVLNVHGGEAEIFADDGEDGIKPLGKMKVLVKDEKLLLDDVNSDLRLAMKRNVDEQSLDCLNCDVIGIKSDNSVWKYDPKGPYDVDQLLKEQALKREVAFNAELEEMQQEALERGRRNLEAPKLTPYEGDWVYQRTTKQDPLTIMGIWRNKQIRIWSFKFDNMDHRLKYELPGFEVTDAGLKIGDSSKAHMYTLNADKTVLTCIDCKTSERWVQADPSKDLSDRNYARKMAGNP